MHWSAPKVAPKSATSLSSSNVKFNLSELIECSRQSLKRGREAVRERLVTLGLGEGREREEREGGERGTCDNLAKRSTPG